MKRYVRRALFVMLALSLTFILGCGSKPAKKSSDNSITEDTMSSSAETTSVVSDSSSASDAIDSEEAALLKIIDSMSLEEKVGQLFLCDPGMLCNNWNVTEINDDLIDNIKKFNVSGFVFFKPNIKTQEQTIEFVENLQRPSKIKLIISVDEEGGKVSRIGSNPDMGIKKQPTMQSIGKSGDPQNAYIAGEELGRDLKSLGFNMNFAPVVDVNTNPDNPVIGSRSFGSDPELVSKMATQEIKGLQDQNVSSVIKHFPGHGDSSTDSHDGSVSLEHDLERLRQVEFVPFVAGIKANADAVMVSHISLPKVTGNDVPASISYNIVTGILREELGFDGLVITDSLSMGAVSKYYELPEYCVESIKAGCDLLLMQSDVEKGDTEKQFSDSYNAVLEAVKSGEISAERLNESVRRIIKVKLNRGIIT